MTAEAQALVQAHLAKVEHEVLDHSDEWGLAYARCYCTYVEEFHPITPDGKA